MQEKGCECSIPGTVLGIDQWILEAGKSKCKFLIDRHGEITVARVPMHSVFTTSALTNATFFRRSTCAPGGSSVRRVKSSVLPSVFSQNEPQLGGGAK